MALNLTILYDNTSLNDDLLPDWGFACAVETPSARVLFDTGANPSILMQNMERLGFSPTSFDFVVVSHNHYDHVGGLPAVLEGNSCVSVVMPEAFPDDLKASVRSAGATVSEVGAATEIADGIYSTGVMNGPAIEHAVALRVRDGMVVVTGCAHPGIAEMVEAAKATLDGDVELLLGGFHLKDLEASSVADIIGNLRQLGVRRVAPCHCTGVSAMGMFAEAWAAGFVQVGAGWSQELRM